ncbi:TPA: hypothetical protein ACPJ1O_004672, partial [Vibrio diabolicus]
THRRNQKRHFNQRKLLLYEEEIRAENRDGASKKIVINYPTYNDLFICYFYLKHIKAVGAKKIEKTK